MVDPHFDITLLGLVVISMTKNLESWSEFKNEVLKAIFEISVFKRGVSRWNFCLFFHVGLNIPQKYHIFCEVFSFCWSVSLWLKVDFPCECKKTVIFPQKHHIFLQNFFACGAEIFLNHWTPTLKGDIVRFSFYKLKLMFEVHNFKSFSDLLNIP